MLLAFQLFNYYYVSDNCTDDTYFWTKAAITSSEQGTCDVPLASEAENESLNGMTADLASPSVPNTPVEISKDIIQ